MTLREYIKALQELEKQHGNKEVWYSVPLWYSSVEEGNNYEPVHYSPKVCRLADVSFGIIVNKNKKVVVIN